MKDEKQLENDEFQFEILPELTQQESKKLQQEYKDRLTTFYSQTKQYSMESWYQELQQFTFESHFFQLTNIEAYLLNHIYQQNHEKLEQPIMKQTYQKLIEKVDIFIKQHFPEGCFFKLSTRSPKDYSWRYEDKQIHQKHVNTLYQKLLPLKLPFGNQLINHIYRYFLEESKDNLKIVSGKQFIQIFSHSQRIQIDINQLMYINGRVSSELDQGQLSRAHDPLLKIWGRKWNGCHWMEEFRCFYNNYQLTAISQYDQNCFFPEIGINQAQIVNKIQLYFQQIKSKFQKLQLSSGAMDLIVKFRDQPISVQLIEVNVFNPNTRASLFSWQQERKILEQGPLQFRYHKTPIQIQKWSLLKMMGMIQRGTGPIITQLMTKLQYQQQWKQMK